MAKKKTVYETDIVIGGRVNRSLNGAVTQAVGLLGKLTGSSGLSGISSNMTALSKVGVGLGVAGVAVTGVVKVMQATVNAAKEAVDAAKEYESAMANVAKVVDGLIDDQGKHTDAYTKMSKDILDLSTKIPMTAVEIAEIVEAAGQANIETDQLVRFAEAAAKMGVAFDTDAEQAGRWMAQWRVVFKMSQDEVESLADQINYLGNTSEAEAVKIAEIVTQAGALGSYANLSASEVAALAAATTGIEPSKAATGISKMLKQLEKGSAKDKRTSVLKAMGFDPDKLKQQMVKDTQGTILSVLKAINNLPEADRMSTITSIFGERLEAVAVLSKNVDLIEESFEKINSLSLYDDSVDKEFEIKSKTFENQLQLWENMKQKFKIEVGTKFLEKLNEIMPYLIEKLPGVLDEVLPKIEKSIKEIDTDSIKKLIDSTIALIPDLTGFVTNTLPTIVSETGKIANNVSEFLNLIDSSLNSAHELLYALKSVKEFVTTGKVSDETVAKLAYYMYQRQQNREKAKEYQQKRNSGTSSGESTNNGSSRGSDYRGKTAGYSNGGHYSEFATGGIVTKPTLALIGEAGENEAVIPLSKLNEMLGQSVTYSQSSTTNTSSSANTYTFAPVINITGDNPQAVRQAVDDGMYEAYEQFKWLMRQYEHEQERTKF